jgi:hypothetical protein
MRVFCSSIFAARSCVFRAGIRACHQWRPLAKERVRDTEKIFDLWKQ